MTKYKVGDKVRVRIDLKKCVSYHMESSKEDYASATSEMCELAGDIVTIRSIEEDMYRIKEKGFYWTDEMFESLDKTTTTEIKLEGNMKFKIKDYKVDKTKETVVVFFEDGDVQKAKCCNGDTFDFERGLEVCVMKHIFKGADTYRKVLKTADEQIIAIDKAKIEAEKRAEIKARQKAKRAEKRKAKAERKRAERIAEMREAYVAALKEYNGDLDKVVEAVESGN